MAEDFRLIVDSLGNYALSALSDAGVEEIRIWMDSVDRTARMEICLASDNWDARAAAIHAMSEVREVFIEDLSLEYSFGPSGDSSRQSATQRTAVFAA